MGKGSLALGVVVMMVSVGVKAEPASVDIFASTRFSDNINKSENSPRNEFEHRVGMSLNKQLSPGTCFSSLGGHVAFLTYERDTFEDRVSAVVDLNANCEPSPYFRWNLRNTVRDVRSVTAAPDTPDNRERRNVFATGPTFIWPVTQRDALFLDLEYQMTRFQRSTVDDSDRYTATTRWQRQFSPQWQGGLSASRSDIDMRRTGEELIQENVSVNFSRRDRRGRFSGQVGQTWLTTEQGVFESQTNAVTGFLRYDHTFDAGTGAFLEGRRTLTDASTDVDVQIPGLDLDLTETSVVKVTSVSTGITQRLPEETYLAVTLSYNESFYERSGTREERYRGSATVSRELTPVVSGRLGVSYTQEDFDQGDGIIAHTYGTSLGLDYRYARNFTINSAVGMEKRDSAGGPGRRYEERWILVGATWNLR